METTFDLIMRTNNGVVLLYHKECGYVSTNPGAIYTALEEDMKGANKYYARLARDLYVQIQMSGGIKTVMFGN